MQTKVWTSVLRHLQYHYTASAAAAPSALTLQWLCRAVLSDTVPLVVSRQLLSAFAQDISQLPDDVHKEAAE